MKKILYFTLLLILPIAFNSCSKDDDNDNEEVFVWHGDWSDPKDANYNPNWISPIIGDWINEEGTSRDVFTENLELKEYYFDKKTGEWVYSGSRGKIKVNDTAFSYLTGQEQTVMYEYKVITENNKRVLMTKLTTDPLRGWSKLYEYK